MAVCMIFPGGGGIADFGSNTEALTSSWLLKLPPLLSNAHDEGDARPTRDCANQNASTPKRLLPLGKICAVMIAKYERYDMP
jgi:hypothetical protein